jgi:hypothetical protein
MSRGKKQYMREVGRRNKKAGLFIKKKFEDAREAKDVLVALAVTPTFCSPIDVQLQQYM